MKGKTLTSSISCLVINAGKLRRKMDWVLCSARGCGSSLSTPLFSPSCVFTSFSLSTLSFAATTRTNLIRNCYNIRTPHTEQSPQLLSLFNTKFISVSVIYVTCRKHRPNTRKTSRNKKKINTDIISLMNHLLHHYSQLLRPLHHLLKKKLYMQTKRKYSSIQFYWAEWSIGICINYQCPI